MDTPAQRKQDDMSRLPYKDSKLSVKQRVDDLISRMTLEEKAGLLFHDIIVMGPGGNLLEKRNEQFGVPPTDEQIQVKLMSHFNLLGPIKDVRETAEWHNKLQHLALNTTRLGIPITISSDPRHHFADNLGTGFNAGALSQWPETLGLAALRSPNLVERFATVARQEYLTFGIRVALHPQVDLATEPRWSRIGRTFGEDAKLSSDLVGPYIQGLQGKELGHSSVSTITKHFHGGDPQKDGEDPHFAYEKEQVYPADNLEYHLQPFKAAIAAGARQMMPYYGKPVGTKFEEVGFGFSKEIITDLLRDELRFTGIVCTDWGLVTDAKIAGQDMPARAWGVEHLTEAERVRKIIEAGCDQLGGESRPELVVQLVQQGVLPESRIDVSVRRLLQEKFNLGLFDNPFVDVQHAIAIVGNAGFIKEGMEAQMKSLTLLTNKENILPIRTKGLRLYLEGIGQDIVISRGFQVVDTPNEADVAILRLKAPYEPRSGGFETMFHAGSLEFPEQEKARQARIFAATRAIVDIHLDRPAIIPEIVSAASAVFVSYGTGVEAFMDVVCGKVSPEGLLPFDLPSSMEHVRNSRSDLQYDTESPTFRFGHGLQYLDK